ncbi:MAG: pilus assembly protein, partial [Burkholderiales bacterium]
MRCSNCAPAKRRASACGSERGSPGGAVTTRSPFGIPRFVEGSNEPREQTLWNETARAETAWNGAPSGRTVRLRRVDGRCPDARRMPDAGQPADALRGIWNSRGIRRPVRPRRPPRPGRARRTCRPLRDAAGETRARIDAVARRARAPARRGRDRLSRAKRRRGARCVPAGRLARSSAGAGVAEAGQSAPAARRPVQGAVGLPPGRCPQRRRRRRPGPARQGAVQPRADQPRVRAAVAEDARADRPGSWRGRAARAAVGRGAGGAASARAVCRHRRLPGASRSTSASRFAPRCHASRCGARVAARRLHPRSAAAMRARPSLAYPRRSVQMQKPCGARQRWRGSAVVESLLAVPIVLLLGLGALQWALLLHARTAAEYALGEAARAGAVGHALPRAIEAGLARGLMPYWFGLDSPQSWASALAASELRLREGQAAGWIDWRQLSPTVEGFGDWGEPARDATGYPMPDTIEIPNDSLQWADLRQPAGGIAGMRAGEPIGAGSGQTLNDANLLKLELRYGAPMTVPMVGRIAVWAMRIADGCVAPSGVKLGAVDLGTPEAWAAPRAWACPIYLAPDASGNAVPRWPVR